MAPRRARGLVLNANERNDATEVDKYLVARVVAQQDANAFGELVRRHQSQIRNFMRKLTRDRDLADDLSQDAFMHAWDRIHTYSGSEKMPKESARIRSC